MNATTDSIPLFKPIVEEWDSYCIIADNPPSKSGKHYNRFSGKRNKELWEVVDKSLPIILGNDTWFIRILEHKIKGLHIDVRKFDLKSDADKEWFVPTEEGLCLRIGEWGQVFDPIFKLLKKWRDK